MRDGFATESTEHTRRIESDLVVVVVMVCLDLDLQDVHISTHVHIQNSLLISLPTWNGNSPSLLPSNILHSTRRKDICKGDKEYARSPIRVASFPVLLLFSFSYVQAG